MLMYIVNNSQKEALNQTLKTVKQASMDSMDENDQEVSPHV